MAFRRSRNRLFRIAAVTAGTAASAVAFYYAWKSFREQLSALDDDDEKVFDESMEKQKKGIEEKRAKDVSVEEFERFVAEEYGRFEAGEKPIRAIKTNVEADQGSLDGSTDSNGVRKEVSLQCPLDEKANAKNLNHASDNGEYDLGEGVAESAGEKSGSVVKDSQFDEHSMVCLSDSSVQVFEESISSAAGLNGLLPQIDFRVSESNGENRTHINGIRLPSEMDLKESFQAPAADSKVSTNVYTKHEMSMSRDMVSLIEKGGEDDHIFSENTAVSRSSIASASQVLKEDSVKEELSDYLDSENEGESAQKMASETERHGQAQTALRDEEPSAHKAKESLKSVILLSETSAGKSIDSGNIIEKENKEFGSKSDKEGFETVNENGLEVGENGAKVEMENNSESLAQ